MYWEPAKYVAKLRALKTDTNPLLFHINMDPAGHGGKSGRYDRLRETRLRLRVPALAARRGDALIALTSSKYFAKATMPPPACPQSKFSLGA